MTVDADIIILSLDRIEQTIAAIDSARGQTGVRSQVYVLDQGTRSDSLRQAVAARPGVTLLTAEQNLGVPGGRNRLSAAGCGRVIVALDNDAVFGAADTVARMVAALDAEPRLAAIGCRIVRDADGADDLSSWGYPGELLPCSGESFDAVTFVGAGHAIRRTAWDQAGGYDARLFFCWEEFDFCLRAIALGWRVRYRGDLVIRHKVSPERRVDWTAARWFYHVRNRLYIERKLDRGWIALAPRIAGYILKGIRNGMPRQTWQALTAAAAMAPRSRATMPAASRHYLVRNDQRHRGSFVQRIIREVAGKIPGVAAATGR